MLENKKLEELKHVVDMDKDTDREILKKMQETSIEKFKKQFPNGATFESGEFLE